MTHFRFIIALLACSHCTLPTLARPGQVLSYQAGSPHSRVGGKSIVNVFPSGYAYQTLLDDGSLTQVLYVTGPDSEIVSKSLDTLRAQQVVPPEHVPVVPPAQSVQPLIGAVPAAPTSAPLFGGALTRFFATPINMLMNFLGLPTLFGGPTLNEGQASNITPLRAPLSNRTRGASTSPVTIVSVTPEATTTVVIPEIPSSVAPLPAEAITAPVVQEASTTEAEPSVQPEHPTEIISAQPEHPTEIIEGGPTHSPLEISTPGEIAAVDVEATTTI